MPIPHIKKESIGYVSAIIAAILFGSVSTITKPVLEDQNALSISSLLYIIAGLSLLPLMTLSSFNSDNIITREYSSNKKCNRKYFLLFVTSICGAVIAPSLFFFGLSNTSASDSSILINGEVLSIILVLAGIVIVTTNMQTSNSFLELNIGNIMIVGSTLFWALDNNISKIISKTIHIPKIIVLKSLIGGSLLFILTVIIFEIEEFKVDLIHIPYLLFAGSLGFGASLFFFLHSLKRIGTVKTILLFSTSSIFGMIFATIFLKENITIYQIIAVTVILSGCYLIKR